MPYVLRPCLQYPVQCLLPTTPVSSKVDARWGTARLRARRRRPSGASPNSCRSAHRASTIKEKQGVLESLINTLFVNLWRVL
jgi:hypothetical protein